VTNLIVAFHNFANAPIFGSLIQLHHVGVSPCPLLLSSTSTADCLWLGPSHDVHTFNDSTVLTHNTQCLLDEEYSRC